MEKHVHGIGRLIWNQNYTRSKSGVITIWYLRLYLNYFFQHHGPIKMVEADRKDISISHDIRTSTFYRRTDMRLHVNCTFKYLSAHANWPAELWAFDRVSVWERQMKHTWSKHTSNLIVKTIFILTSQHEWNTCSSPRTFEKETSVA